MDTDDKNGQAEDFDWVTARHECSPFAMFQQLRLEAQQNVDRRNALRKDRNENEIFSFNASGDTFTVGRERTMKVVDFKLQGGTIIVSGPGISKPIKATVTLGDPYSDCELHVDGRRLQRWNFLRMALEELFFGDYTGHGGYDKA